MRKIKLLVVFLIPAFYLSAQISPVYNGGFEEWSPAVTFESTEIWRNSNLDHPWMNTILKSNDAFAGDYSLYLESVYSEDEQEDIFGWAVLGEPNDDFLGIPYDTPVDSLVAYVKYDVMPGDSALILVVQFIDGEQELSAHYFTGSIQNWKRVAMPLALSAQDSVFIGFASGNGLNEFTIAGSSLMVDEVSFVSNTTTAPVLPNAGFENWSTYSYHEPVNWFGRDNEVVPLGGPETVTKTDDSHSGDYAVVIQSVSIDIDDDVEGFLTNGEVIDSFIQGNDFTEQPERFEGYFKYFPAANDFGIIQVFFLKNDVAIEVGTLVLEDTVDTYTKFTIDLEFTEQPDEMYITMTSGYQSGSKLILDDLVFASGVVNTKNVVLQNIFEVAPNPTNGLINVKLDESIADQIELSLLSLEGKTIFENTYNSEEQTIDLNLGDLPSGTYWLRWRSKDRVIVEKILKQ